MIRFTLRKIRTLITGHIPAMYNDEYCDSVISKYSYVKSYSDLINELSQIKFAIYSEINNTYQSSAQTIKNCLKINGDPAIYLDYNKLHKSEILCYHKIIGGYKARVELHFHKNNLFFYKYTFPYLTNTEKQKIISQLKEKYKIGKNIDLESTYVELNNKTRIVIFNDFELQLNYVIYNSIFIKELLMLNTNNYLKGFPTITDGDEMFACI